MITRRFLMTVLLVAAFFVPSLGQAWSFTYSDNSLNRSGASCWQLITVQSQECEGEECPESGAGEIPAEDEEPDCE